MLELPAGMLDDDKGDVVGTAVREVSLAPSPSPSLVCCFGSVSLEVFC